MTWFVRRRVAAPTPAMEWWAPLGYVTAQAGHVQQPDLKPWVRPQMLGDQRVWPGLQLRQGVGQLSLLLEVPTASGVPFWQLQQLQRPSQYTRYGGSAATPAVGSLPQQAKQDYYAGANIDGSGPKVRLGRLTRRSR